MFGGTCNDSCGRGFCSISLALPVLLHGGFVVRADTFPRIVIVPVSVLNTKSQRQNERRATVSCMSVRNVETDLHSFLIFNYTR